jgi:hypothetical protein
MNLVRGFWKYLVCDLVIAGILFWVLWGVNNKFLWFAYFVVFVLWLANVLRVYKFKKECENVNRF